MSFMKENGLVILGSTGSIGTQSLEVAEALGIPVVALAANSSIDLLETQARRFRPQVVSVVDETASATLKTRLGDTDIQVLSGMDGLIEASVHADASVVLTAIVGMAGLLPTIAAIKAGKDIALANKETLVCAGSIVMPLAKQHGVNILPVDSEHSAIFQCLQSAADKKALEKVILTASGGPFFGRTAKDLESVTKKDALKHPNWSMGAKITIDSATMMNKGLEFIEAMWLYDLNHAQVDIVIHRESIVHSLVQFHDSSVLAQLGLPDMRLPIQYALTYPERVATQLFTPLDLAKIATLTFAAPDEETFACLRVSKQAAAAGGNAGAVVNGANEAAVALFLQDKISFLDIGRCVEHALSTVARVASPSLDDLLDSDREARVQVLSFKE